MRTAPLEVYEVTLSTGTLTLVGSSFKDVVGALYAVLRVTRASEIPKPWTLEQISTPPVLIFDGSFEQLKTQHNQIETAKRTATEMTGLATAARCVASRMDEKIITAEDLAKEAREIASMIKGRMGGTDQYFQAALTNYERVERPVILKP